VAGSLRRNTPQRLLIFSCACNRLCRSRIAAVGVRSVQISSTCEQAFCEAVQ
jgi:hypothetical protein